MVRRGDNLGGAGHRDQERARSGMELVAVNARGARAGRSSRQQRCSSSSIEAEAKQGRGAWRMHAAAQCWQRQRGGARRRGRPGALAAAAPELSKTSRADGRGAPAHGDRRGDRAWMAPVEGGGGEGKRRGDRARWIGRSGALPGDASMRAMGIECGAEGGRGGDRIRQGMFGPVGLGLGGAPAGP